MKSKLFRFYTKNERNMSDKLNRRLFLKIILAFFGVILTIFGFLKFFGEKKVIIKKGVTIELPSPRKDSKVSIEKALEKRRSIREYTNKPLSLFEVSQLLWAAQGITEPLRKFRTAPSAGALYPLELFLVVGNVKDLESGIYHYNIPSGNLILYKKGDFRKELAVAAVDQEWVENAAMDIVVCAIYERTTKKYGDRGKRYVHIEVGHVGQNIYLQAESLNIGVVVIGAFYDDMVQKILEVEEEVKPLYIISVGKK